MGEVSVSMDFLMSLIGELYVKLRVQQNENEQLRSTLETYITQLQQVREVHQQTLQSSTPSTQTKKRTAKVR